MARDLNTARPGSGTMVGTSVNMIIDEVMAIQKWTVTVSLSELADRVGKPVLGPNPQTAQIAQALKKLGLVTIQPSE